MSRTREAFTLIELLVVIAIIALLIGILLPTLGAARDTARSSQCASNIRQVVTALALYANDNGGHFPPSLYEGFPVTPEGNTSAHWFDKARIGEFLPDLDETNLTDDNTESPTIGGGTLVCPSHQQGGRSYTMNYWAASAGDAAKLGGKTRFYKPGTSPDDQSSPGLGMPPVAKVGKSFDAAGDFSSSLLLAGEAWGLWPSALRDDNRFNQTRWFTEGNIGRLQYPGERFAASGPTWRTGGLHPQIFKDVVLRYSAESPELATGEWDTRKEKIGYMPFYRHGTRDRDPQTLGGTANFGFLDGHVDSFRHQDLVDGERSSYKVLWSVIDREVEENLDD